jgi:hypothetical protein
MRPNAKAIQQRTGCGRKNLSRLVTVVMSCFDQANPQTGVEST